ncbi:hypothetical protein V1477_019647 [Vespula maculifrons]|uniref:Uncharacterized protein n=1 Tax=Vespula maculifrons TaxID=7453 RepID=A0ABD2AR18_VESMC
MLEKHLESFEDSLGFLKSISHKPDCGNSTTFKESLALVLTLTSKHPLNFTKSSIARYWLEYLPVTMRHAKIRAEFNYNALTKRERPMKAELFGRSLVMEVLESCTRQGYKVNKNN